MKTSTTASNIFLRYLYPLVLTCIFLLLLSCGSRRMGDIPSNYEQLEELVDSQQFEIEHDWAIPLRGGTINIAGNSNYIRFEGDSVDLFLPYFGVRHMGGAYGGDGGIEYHGPVNNIEIVKEEERITLEFEADSEGENLDFFLTLYSSGNVNTSVQSAERDNISYRGTIRERILKAENQKTTR